MKEIEKYAQENNLILVKTSKNLTDDIYKNFELVTEKRIYKISKNVKRNKYSVIVSINNKDVEGFTKKTQKEIINKINTIEK